MMPAPPKEWVLITLADLRGRPEHASQALSHAWVEWQEHPPGEEVALDFSSGNELEVTIGGEPFVTRGRGWQRDPIR